jgi:uncharacterized protein (DUF433 family)
MPLQLDPLQVPLERDEIGRVRVRGHRIDLANVAWLVRRGETVEDVQEAYPTIPLPDLLVILAFIHANRAAVDEYVEERRQQEAEARAHWEPKFEELHRERAARIAGGGGA